MCAILDQKQHMYIPVVVVFIVVTIYVKLFEGENFRRFLLTANVLPLKIFLEYRHCPLTTQSMVSPGLKFSTTKVFPTY